MLVNAPGGSAVDHLGPVERCPVHVENEILVLLPRTRRLHCSCEQPAPVAGHVRHTAAAAGANTTAARGATTRGARTAAGATATRAAVSTAATSRFIYPAAAGAAARAAATDV